MNKFCNWLICAIYRVAQNKPHYLLLLSKSCISTRKHVSLIMYMWRQKHQSKRCSMCPQPVATTSDNRLQNCPVVRLITSWPICSQQVGRTSFKCSRSRIRQGR